MGTVTLIIGTIVLVKFLKKRNAKAAVTAPAVQASQPTGELPPAYSMTGTDSQDFKGHKEKQGVYL